MSAGLVKPQSHDQTARNHHVVVRGEEAHLHDISQPEVEWCPRTAAKSGGKAESPLSWGHHDTTRHGHHIYIYRGTITRARRGWREQQHVEPTKKESAEVAVVKGFAASQISGLLGANLWCRSGGGKRRGEAQECLEATMRLSKVI